jgi:hypothetical protein
LEASNVRYRYVDRDQRLVSPEQPELWPETISDIGRLVGGGNHFWSADSGLVHAQPNPLASEAACHGVFLLSRADLKVLDQYTAEFDNLIIRFLRLVFLSVLWSQKEIGAREALGARMVRRYLKGREASRSDVRIARRLIAAMWEECSISEACNTCSFWRPILIGRPGYRCT